MTTPPSRYVQPDVSEMRLNRVWGNVSARLRTQPSRAWRWVALCTALSAAAGGAFFVAKAQLGPPSAEPASMLAAAKLETGGDPLAVTLVDGSQVSLASHSEVQVRGKPFNLGPVSRDNVARFEVK